MTVAVRVGDADDYDAVMNVLEGALLDVAPDRVRAGLRGSAGLRGDAAPSDRGRGVDVLVAEADGSTVGALVLDGDRVTAVAVRRSRRGRGVGTALVEAALDRRGRLTASFDARVGPFYESLGFEIRPAGGGDDGDRFEAERRRE